MKLVVTENIRQFCLDCSKEATLSKELRHKASDASKASSIEWNDLKELATSWNNNTAQGSSSQIRLHELCRGTNISLPPPPPKQGKSPELQAHLEQLQRQLDQQRYDKMVWEVIQEEKEAQRKAEGGLKTYKQQITYGIHIILMMAAFYIFGHIAGRAITSNPVYHPAVGLVFMFFAMLMETTLYIIRTTTPPAHPIETTMKKLPNQETSNSKDKTTSTKASSQTNISKNVHNRQKSNVKTSTEDLHKESEIQVADDDTTSSHAKKKDR